MIMVFLTTSITFKYLENSDYGIWVTIYSIISWVYFLDFGFSNVIKTKLPTLLQDNDNQKSTLISTVYIGLGLVSLTILLLYSILQLFLSFGNFLNINSSNFNAILFLNLFFSSLILIIGNYKSLYAGTLKTHIVEFSMMIIQIFVFCSIYIVLKFDLFENIYKITIISYVFGLTNLLIGLIFTVYFFTKTKNIKISFKYFDLDILKTNAKLGLKYFIIQACMIIIYSTDYLLITKYFGTKEVANYDIVLKIFQTPMLLVIAGLSPFWAIFSKTYVEKKYLWIKKTLVIYNISFIVFITGIVILTLIIDEIIYLWVNVKIEISISLLISISLYVTMRAFTAMYNYFLNGINKINVTLYLTILGAVINIPICLLLIKFDFGISGIVVGTCISILPTTIVLPIQTFNIINKKIKNNNDN